MQTINLYDKTVRKEIRTWQREMLKKPGIIGNVTHSIQSKTQNLVPQKVQDFITTSIKSMTETIMSASSMITSSTVETDITLSESDYLVEKAYKTYNKVAIAQGVGFGLGGIFMGLADFPALLSLKVKFLFDCAKMYGFNINDPSERLFMLYVFQLAFSSDSQRAKLYPIVRDWDRKPVPQVDWETFQKEYRDTIDFAKMLQLLPVVGSLAGGSANHNLLKRLKVTAMNSYRLRVIRRQNALSKTQSNQHEL